MKKIAIIQSNYIPWKGYFDIINMVDEFIFHDDVQYTTQDWRNRNQIKTAEGKRWITVPCGGTERQLIYEVGMENSSWQKTHWNILTNAYGKAPFFDYYRPFFEDFYLGNTWDNLSLMNQYLIKKISKEVLFIDTVFKDSREYNVTGKKAEKVLNLILASKGEHYLSGPMAKSYISEELLQPHGIGLEWMDYSGYREYDQLYPPFDHGVSIVDLLFNVGPENLHQHLKSFSAKVV